MPREPDQHGNCAYIWATSWVGWSQGVLSGVPSLQGERTRIAPQPPSPGMRGKAARTRWPSAAIHPQGGLSGARVTDGHERVRPHLAGEAAFSAVREQEIYRARATPGPYSDRAPVVSPSRILQSYPPVVSPCG